MKPLRDPVSQRKIGRPKLADPSANICARVPGSVYDQLQKRAGQGQSLSAYVRKVLILHIGR